MCYKVPNWCLCNIYFTSIHSYILYGLEVYGNTYPSYLDKLTILNNKLLRTLQKNESLYLQYKILPPVQPFNYQVLNLVHKVVYSPHLLPSIFHNYFTLNSSIHRYKTRHNVLYLTHVNTRFGQQILRYKGLVVQLSCVTDVSVSHVLLVERFVSTVLKRMFMFYVMVNCGIVYPLILLTALHPNAFRIS